ncbi:MAG: TIGR02117 family protein [Bacteroidetes bacterium]|nr:TIGR02117 family protein [Bacteroidota bacterium]
MLKRVFKLVLKTFLVIVLALGTYMLAAFTLPNITVNNSFVNKKEGVKIYIVSNGVHTDIVVPVKNKNRDWTKLFPPESFDVKDSIYNYMAFGWGDKGFYLDTPTWGDLTFSTAFKAAFGIGSTAMHVRYLKLPNIIPDKTVALIIDEKSYNELIQLIEKSFEKTNDAVIKIDHPGYNDHDRFYEANGTYSAFKTCNVWTNTCLKTIGVKVSVWSPFSKGLINSLKQN